MSRPSDSYRLSVLLEGLEASILPKSKLENLITIGSEYYLPYYVENQETLRKSGFKIEKLSKICSRITDGDHGSADYQEEGIGFVLSENVKEGWIDSRALRRISPEHHRTLARCSLKINDILVTKTGVYFGKSAVVDSSLGEANTIAHVGILRIKNGQDPYFLSTFLNSIYGQSQLRRRGIKATRPEIKLVEFHDIEVPCPSDELQKRIRTICLKSKEIRASIDRRFKEAEDTLLAALGLLDWTPQEPLSYTARASAAFTAGRIDAQYFRPLFAEVEQRLDNTGRAVELDAILSTNSRGRQPSYADAGLPVINSKHVRTNRVILSDNRTATEEGSPVIIEKGDVLVNGTGVGTIGRASSYLHDQRALPDNHVTVLRTTHVDPVYLAAFLNSALGQWQIERYIKGSSGQIELYPGDIAKIVFWDAPADIQATIRDAVLSAFTEERQAQDLLDAAKRAVEMAIEDGEATAMAFLDQVKGAS